MSKYYKTIMIIISADIIAIAVMFLLGITGTVDPSKKLLSSDETTVIPTNEKQSATNSSGITEPPSSDDDNITTQTISSDAITDNTDSTDNLNTEQTTPPGISGTETTSNVTDNNTEQFIVLSTTSKVYLREMPSTNGKIIKELSSDSYGNVISTDGRWTKVEYQGTTGYVFTDYLATGATAKDLIKNLSYSKVIVNSSCNMRRSPDTNDTVFGNAIAGTTYRYDKSKSNDNWYAIYLKDGSMAYISTGYASVCN